MTYTDQIDALGPQNWWKCDDAGSTLVDSAGAANITFSGTGTGAITPAIGAINRDTDNKSVAITQGDGTGLTTTANVSDFEKDSNWTLAGWIKQDAGETATMAPLSVAEAANATRMYVRVISLAIVIRFLNRGGAITTANNATGTLSDGEWTHVAVVRTATAFRLYVNGIQSGTDSTNATTFAGLAGFTGTKVSLGSRVIDGDSGIEGRVDEGMYFTRALTDAEMLELYRAGAEIIAAMGDPQFGFPSELDTYAENSLDAILLNRQRFEQTIHKINLLEPDLTVIVGDTTDGPTTREISFFDESLLKLKGQVMITDGNHDARLEASVDAFRVKYNALGVLPNNTANGASHFDLPSGYRVVEYSSNYYYTQFPDFSFDAADRTANASEVGTKLSGATRIGESAGEGKAMVFTHVGPWTATETTAGPANRDLLLNVSSGFREDALVMIRSDSNVSHILCGHRHINTAITPAASDGLLITSFIGTAREFATAALTNFDFGIVYVIAEGDIIDIDVIEFDWQPLLIGQQNRFVPDSAGILRRPSYLR